MVDLPYYYEESRKKYLESLIPIIILLLIAIVLIGKTTTFFCSVPGLSALFCGGRMINIAVIGDFTTGDTLVKAPELKALLDGEIGRACNMQYQVFAPEDLTYVKESLLKKYDLLVLVGERNYTRPVREAVENYLKNGGKIVIIGDAATKDPEDPLYIGWGHIKVPMVLRQNPELSDDGIPYVNLKNPELRVVDLENPIVVGYGLKVNLTEIPDKPSCGGGEEGLTVIDVNPTTGTTVFVVTGESDEKKKTIPAVIEESSMFGGTVYYFAFDPGCMPNAWVSTVQQITGKATCVAGA